MSSVQDHGTGKRSKRDPIQGGIPLEMRDDWTIGPLTYFCHTGIFNFKIKLRRWRPTAKKGKQLIMQFKHFIF